MARIRTIKPDFWTDEKITECSVSTRLFFIGCWNFADDNGNLQRSAKKLKMQIFPADAIDCEPLIQELMTHGLLSEYSVSEDKFLHIKGFTKHQVINRPSKTGLPLHDFKEDSVSTPAQVNDDSGTEGKGREGKGKEEHKPRASRRSPAKTRLPEIFEISDRVEAWAQEKGFKSLPEHLEAFKRKAAMKGYEYVDWDMAFMEAVREDWAHLRKNGTAGSAAEGVRFAN